MSAESTSPIKRLAFIGTGLMGAPMVRRLLAAGFEVRVWNRTRAKLAALLALGARECTSPAQAAQGVDLLCTCVTDAAALEAVIFDNDGLASARGAADLLVDFSTVGPEATRTLAARLQAAAGCRWVDAPVSGGATGAEQGRLIVFCGGEEADIRRLDPVFGAIAQRVNRVGALGSGQTLKLCNQLIVATSVCAIAEALLLARSSGLSLPAVPPALAGGFADSLPLQIFGRRMAEDVTTPVLGELGLMLKDLSAAEALGRSEAIELPLARAALDIYHRARERGLLDNDIAALFSLYRDAPPSEV